MADLAQGFLDVCCSRTVMSSSCGENVSDTYLVASLCVLHTATVHVHSADKQKSFASIRLI